MGFEFEIPGSLAWLARLRHVWFVQLPSIHLCVVLGEAFPFHLQVQLHGQLEAEEQIFLGPFSAPPTSSHVPPFILSRHDVWPLIRPEASASRISRSLEYAWGPGADYLAGPSDLLERHE